jgi:hypothetical protein
MKKFLIVLGSIFLAIIVLVAIGIAFVAVRGAALDKESKAYAQEFYAWEKTADGQYKKVKKAYVMNERTCKNVIEGLRRR